MKKINRLLAIFFVLSLLGSSCKEKHDTTSETEQEQSIHSETNHEHMYHNILSIPYDSSKIFFRRLCSNNKIVPKCVWVKPCNGGTKGLNYVPFYCGNSKRKFFDESYYSGNIDLLYIWVPYYSDSAVISTTHMLRDVIDGDFIPNESPRLKKGSMGCNNFLMSGDQSESNFQAEGGEVSSDAKKSLGCHLDFFTYNYQRYINLLFVSHEEHEASGNNKVYKFTNHDFAISIQDYKTLDSLLRGNKYLLGGIDKGKEGDLKIYENAQVDEPLMIIKRDVRPSLTSVKDIHPFEKLNN